jgi:hypothetical protein
MYRKVTEESVNQSTVSDQRLKFVEQPSTLLQSSIFVFIPRQISIMLIAVMNYAFVSFLY